MAKPRPAAQSIASSELAAIHTGGCGFCNGLGSTSTPSNAKFWPAKCNLSCVQACNTISTVSRKRDALSCGGMPKASNSTRAKPRPAPQLTRPPDRMSSSATSSEPQWMIKRRQRHGGADAQPAGVRRGQCGDHMHRRTDAEAREMMFGEPHRVIAGAVHDPDAREGASIDRGQIDATFRPTEELQHGEFHRATIAAGRPRI